MIKNSLVLSLLFIYSNLTFAQKSNAIIGIWLNEEKDAQIEVYEKDKLFFGKIVWLKNAKDENGNWVLDSKNPDVSLRNRKKMGLTILHNLKWDGDKNEWNGGEIYDSREGDTYSLFARVDSENELNLRGYIGFSLFGKTTTWTRSSLQQ